METELLLALKGRQPVNRRRGNFYLKLDKLIPDWAEIVNEPEFSRWMMCVDSQSGACMYDRLKVLWQDPLYSAGDFATLLRLFVRWKNKQEKKRRSGGWRCWFQHENTPKKPVFYPVLSGKYEMLGILGRGGNGEVYLVWSTETNSLYAIKTIRTELAIIPKVRQSFRNEALAWIQLGEHPNIAKAYFFEELGSRLYITMSYIESDNDGIGPSLADKIAASKISLGKLCTWFCQVADGLNHSYMCGIHAHRDIKPGNILIDRDNIACVSDFGLAVTTDVLLTAGVHNDLVAGTPLFMSPEQFVGSSGCDQRSDLYSLGVTLYQATSGGSLPFSPNLSPPQTQDELDRYFFEIRVLHEHTQPNPIESPLWPIIKKCLSKSPDDRFSSIMEFRAALVDVALKHRISIPQPHQVSEDFWFLQDQGNTLMRLGKYEEAIKSFDAYLVKIPDDNVIFNRAVCLENLGKYKEAFNVYERFVKRNDAKGLMNGSNCLRKLGRKDEALTYAQRAVKLRSADCDCWICLGNAAFSMSQWQDAMSAYSKARDLDNIAPTPAYNFGLAAERAGAYKTAQQAYLLFMELSLPDDSRRPYVEEAFHRIGKMKQT